MEFEFLKAIKEEGLNQREFAKLANTHESVISRIINGRWKIDQMRRIKFAKILGKRPEDIFPSDD